MLALKQRLAEVIAPEVADGEPGLATGIGALDRVLVDGIPLGRLTEIVGPMGSGKTTLVRSAVAAAVARGVGVAYIDAERTLAPRDWVEVAEAGGDGFWVVRPPDGGRGAWSADVVLRSGGFGLVVLDGVPRLARAVAVRLTQLARQGGAALVAVGDEDVGWRASALGAALRLRVRAGSGGFVVIVEKGGHQTVEVQCGVRLARRLCTHPEVPDRRGVARRSRGAGGTLPPSRRMGTPDYPPLG